MVLLSVESVGREESALNEAVADIRLALPEPTKVTEVILSVEADDEGASVALAFGADTEALTMEERRLPKSVGLAAVLMATLVVITLDTDKFAVALAMHACGMAVGMT